MTRNPWNPDQPATTDRRLSRRGWLRAAGLVLLGTAGSGLLAACGAAASGTAASSSAASGGAGTSARVSASPTTAAASATTESSAATPITTSAASQVQTGTAGTTAASTASQAPTVASTASSSAAPASVAQGNKPSLIFSSWGSPAEQQSDRDCLKAFNETYPNADFAVKIEDAPWEGFHEHLQVEAAGGTSPDIMVVSVAFFPNFAHLGMFRDISSDFTRDKLDWSNLPPGTQNFMTIDGKLYGMPTGGLIGNGAMIAFSQPLLDSAGLTAPGEDWTWDDLVHLAQKLTSGGANDPNAHWGVDFGKTTWGGLWETMLSSYGGAVWNRERTASTIDSQEAKTTFQYFKDLADRWNVSGPDPDQKPFYAGKIGMTTQYANGVTIFIDKASFPLYTVLTPAGPKGHGIQPPTGQSHAYTIAATSKHPDDAWQYVHFLLTDPAAERARSLAALESVSWRPNLPIYADKLPANLKQWWTVQQYYLAHTPAFEALPPEITSRVLPTNAVEIKIVTDQLNSFYAGKVTASAAVAEMQRLLDAALKQAQATAAQ
jgi:multiple sugar transport system substrate-binding protein